MLNNSLRREVFRPTDLVPKGSISKWYSLRQEDNVLLGVAGAAGCIYAGAAVGIAIWGKSREHCVCQLYLEGCMEEDFWNLKKVKGKFSYCQLLVRSLKEVLFFKIL